MRFLVEIRVRAGVSAEQAESLCDEALPVEVRELPGDSRSWTGVIRSRLSGSPRFNWPRARPEPIVFRSAAESRLLIACGGACGWSRSSGARCRVGDRRQGRGGGGASCRLRLRPERCRRGPRARRRSAVGLVVAGDDQELCGRFGADAGVVEQPRRGAAGEALEVDVELAHLGVTLLPASSERAQRLVSHADGVQAARALEACAVCKGAAWSSVRRAIRATPRVR